MILKFVILLIYLGTGAVCDKDGIVFQAANLYEFSSGYRQSTIYYAYGSDAISSPEQAYIVTTLIVFCKHFKVFGLLIFSSVGSE